MTKFDNGEGGAPLISIILICLNSSKTIEQTLQSIVNLDYPNIELIVIDGASSDGTIAILNRYSQYIDRLVIEKDKGIYDAMNKGAKLATGEFLYFVGSDDIVINSWNNLIGKLKSKNTVYYGNVYFPISNRIFDGKYGYLRLLTRNISHQAIFYPKAVFEKYQYSEQYPLLADFHLNLMINSDRGFKFKYIDFLVAVYSEKGASKDTYDKQFVKDHLKIIKDNYRFIVYLYTWLRMTIAKLLTK